MKNIENIFNVKEIEAAMNNFKSATVVATSKATVTTTDGVTTSEVDMVIKAENSKSNLSYSIVMDGICTKITLRKSWYLKVLKAIINFISVITDGEKAIKVTTSSVK